MCVIMQNFAKIGQQLRRYRDLAFLFQIGRHPPPWIKTARIWTTHDEYTWWYIIAQNVVGIDAVVLIICEFQYFAR